MLFDFNRNLMLLLSEELSVSPRGELILGCHAIYGEIHDIESGDELFIPRGGFRICGICDAVIAGPESHAADEVAWITPE